MLHAEGTPMGGAYRNIAPTRLPEYFPLCSRLYAPGFAGCVGGGGGCAGARVGGGGGVNGGGEMEWGGGHPVKCFPLGNLGEFAEGQLFSVAVLPIEAPLPRLRTRWPVGQFGGDVQQQAAA